MASIGGLYNYHRERTLPYLFETESLLSRTTLDSLTYAEGIAKGIKFYITQLKVLQWTDMKIVKFFAEFISNQIKYYKPGADVCELLEAAKRLLPLRKGELRGKHWLDAVGIIGIFVFRALNFIKHLGEQGLFSLSKLATTIGSVPVVGGLMSYVTISRFGAFSLCFEVASQCYKIQENDEAPAKARIKLLSDIQYIWDKQHEKALRRKHNLSFDWTNDEIDKYYAAQKHLADVSAAVSANAKLNEAERKLVEDCKAFDQVKDHFIINDNKLNVELETLLKPWDQWKNLDYNANKKTFDFHVRKWTLLKKIEEGNQQRPWVALVAAITKLFAIVVVGEIFTFMGIALSKGWDLVVGETCVIPNFYKVWLGRYAANAEPKMPKELREPSMTMLARIA